MVVAAHPDYDTNTSTVETTSILQIGHSIYWEGWLATYRA